MIVRVSIDIWFCLCWVGALFFRICFPLWNLGMCGVCGLPVVVFLSICLCGHWVLHVAHFPRYWILIWDGLEGLRDWEDPLEEEKLSLPYIPVEFQGVVSKESSDPCICSVQGWMWYGELKIQDKNSEDHFPHSQTGIAINFPYSNGFLMQFKLKNHFLCFEHFWYIKEWLLTK